MTEQIRSASGTPMTVANMGKSGLAAFLDLADEFGAIKLESALKRRVTEECLSMYNVDGSMRKASKSTLLQQPRDHISLVDMGLMWRLATPTEEDREASKRDGSQYRWRNYLGKICCIIFSRHRATRLIILVNDRYDLPFTIKDDEHERRAAKPHHRKSTTRFQTSYR